MRYAIELKPRAQKDLRSMGRQDQERVIERLRLLENDLRGDVKRLSNFTPEYRMRAGDWRALFEVAGNRVVVYRILHRKEAYR
jgi:mRNA interferase RelE/StbE